ncbi:MAG: DUF92 domain-containing protein [Bacteroidetes bacterium]|nr:DUF92 domain-containing protein [Bacteroidota bacterium]MDA1225064.1 DUF92 domain-containing protein [Bacteroidota bacterium]
MHGIIRGTIFMNGVEISSFPVALIISVLVAWSLIKWNWLTVSGALMACALAFVVVILAKWSIFPLITFLVLGSMAGKLRFRKDAAKVVGFEVVKEGGDAKQGKARDHWQVLANGGIFMLLAMLAFLNDSGWLEFFLGIHTEVLRFSETCHLLAIISLAVSCADTLSSDFGRVWGGNPRNIITGKRMLKGVSGGVTGAGFVGAFVGTVSIAIFVLWSEFSSLGNSASLFCIVVVFGFIGSILDSVLGVLFQAKYLDEMGSQVDSSDSGRRSLNAGYRWVTNDVVNAVTGILMLLVAVMYLCW